MFNDRVIKWLSGMIGALLLIIGGTLCYDALKPVPAEARSYYVELSAICNAYIEGEAPWCAEVFNVKGDKVLGVVEER